MVGRAALGAALAAALVPGTSGAVTYKALNTYVSTAVCWDNSSAGVYHRPALYPHQSNNIIIYLQGGGFCNCRAGVAASSPCIPCEQYPQADQWGWTADDEITRYIDLDVIPEWKYAHVYWLPYCTGDLWGGDTLQALAGGVQYRGYRIVEALAMHIQQTLPGNTDTSKPQWAVLTGNSAGGMGTVIMAHQLRAWLRVTWPALELYQNPRAGILPTTTPANVPCPGATSLPMQAMFFLWGMAGSQDWCPPPWTCGDVSATKVSTVPMFMQQHLHDDNFYPRMCPTDDGYYSQFADLIIGIGKKIVETNNGHAVWLKGCKKHSFNFFHDQIGGVAHADAFRCWWAAVRAGRLAEAALASRVDGQATTDCAELPASTRKCSEIMRYAAWPELGQTPPNTPGPHPAGISPASGLAAQPLLLLLAVAVAALL